MNDGGPAFPRPGFTPEQTESQEGMTYRQWLIGMALTGMNISPDYSFGPANAHIAERAVDIADRIIAALEKEGK